MKRALIAGLVLGLAAAVPWQQEKGRPVILLLHGRGMLDRDTSGTRQFWYDGLRTGAKALKLDGLITTGDVRLVWYADVLDPRSTEACDYSSDDRRARNAAVGEPGLRDFVSLVGNFLGALTELVDDSLAATELRTLSGDASFLGDARKRCASERRLAAAIDRAQQERRPVILVAHSLGSLVAYDYLSTRRDSGVVDRLVTVGSMLGATELRRLLLGGNALDDLVMPPSVASWVNVRNRGDLLAIAIPFGRDVVTEAPAGEPDHHDMVSYLRNSATADAILGGWCAAFRSSRPAGCLVVTELRALSR